MPQPADPVNGHQIAFRGAAVAEPRERRPPGTQQRRGLGQGNTIGNAHDRFLARDSVFGIATVDRLSGRHLIAAGVEIARTAGTAFPATAGAPAHADPLTDREL